MGDFRILGIDETRDIDEIKRAFRSRAKALHPDLAPPGKGLGLHLEFVELRAAYGRLMASTQPKPLQGRPARLAAAHVGLGRHRAHQTDPAYSCYRTGMGFFMRIHPSEWNIAPDVLNTRIAGHEEEQELIRRRLADLIELFPRAYYFFGLVVEMFPDSTWAWDSGEKLRRIDDLVRRYARILESFSTWNPDRMEEIREYHRVYDAHGIMRKSVSPEGRRRWDFPSSRV